MAPVAYPQSYYAASAHAAPERPALEGNIDTDVCIIGAGFTGLWTAHSLLRADPSIRVTTVRWRGEPA